MLVSAILLQRNGQTTHSVDEYISSFEQIAALDLPTMLFLDPRLFRRVPARRNVMVREITIEQLPLFGALGGSLIEMPAKRNQWKDNFDYLVIQNSKTWFMYEAIAQAPHAERLAWIDAGVMHFLKDTKELERLRFLDPVQGVVMPGMYAQQSVSTDEVCWRFAGSFFHADVQSVLVFHELCTHKIIKHLPRLAWEVNTWAEIELEHPSLIHWCYGAHDETLLRNC